MSLPGATGPNTLIGLGKGKADKAALVKKLVPHYKTLLEKLKSLGVSEVQLHEPILVTPGANQYQVGSHIIHSMYAPSRVSAARFTSAIHCEALYNNLDLPTEWH